MSTWRRLLLPFSLLYGVGVWIRNFLFDKGILKSESFSVRTIGVGNLMAGGTGKTPHVEYLIQLLKDSYSVATLSRGYGRETKGFYLAGSTASASMIGDEPMQYFSKFDNVQVVVGEDRAAAIHELMRLCPTTDIVLMDDNFQHRQVKAGLQILLINYENLDQNELLLPAGNLREPHSSVKRADIVVVSKTPSILVPIERKRIIGLIKASKGTPVFFSYYKYGEFVRLHGRADGLMMGADYYLEKRFTILLVAGIANPSGLIEYLRRHTDKLEILTYPDHHPYSIKDMDVIREAFELIPNTNKIIVTTEKDAMRFRQPDIEPLTRQLPLFYVPIHVFFHQDKEQFDQHILNYVSKNNRHH